MKIGWGTLQNFVRSMKLSKTLLQDLACCQHHKHYEVLCSASSKHIIRATDEGLCCAMLLLSSTYIWQSGTVILRKLDAYWPQEWFWQTKPRKGRFANFQGRSPELVPEPLSACKCYTKPLEESVPELIPDSFLESLRTSLCSVWFAGASPDGRH